LMWPWFAYQNKRFYQVVAASDLADLRRLF